jgi:hypothetical protein
MTKKLLIAIIVLFGTLEIFAQGCSTCRAQIESADGSSLSVGNGLNTGIFILMGVPYVILFLIFRKPIVRFVKSFFVSAT